MVAARLADVDDLNRRARYTLWDEGHLGDDRIVLAGRPFAEHDTVLALRNDYQLGVLNGTRATVERIDTWRHEMTLAVNDRQRVVVPFAYAEAGHLTHGYATTIHKAQGATVDRCYVLADDTLAREHAYTALSRGRHGNDLYVVAPDRRTEEAHAVEVEPDQLDALRHAIARSGAKRMAIDQDDPQTTRLQQLRAERDEIGAHIGYGPPNPSSEYSRLCDEIDRERYGRDNAEWRLDNVRRSLDDLGPVGRLTRRAERHELEHRIDGCTDEIDRHEQKLSDLDTRLAKLEPRMRTRERWETAHATDLDRLDTLERQINITERLDRVASSTRDRGVDYDLGVEL